MEFEKTYFYKSKVSNYMNYLEKKYSSLAEELIDFLKIQTDDHILDFGCATGLLVYEFVSRGFMNVKGTDISYWAIQYGKKELKLDHYLEYFNINLLTEKKDYLFFLDVLEHIGTDELEKLFTLSKINRPGKIIMRVPVAKEEGQDFSLDVSRNDKTHIQCHNADWWIQLFRQNGYNLESRLQLKNIFCSDGVFAGVFL